jgi:hypothetical protein
MTGDKPCDRSRTSCSTRQARYAGVSAIASGGRAAGDGEAFAEAYAERSTLSLSLTGARGGVDAQATVPESLIPLSFAAEPNCSVVLAGDPHQLGPVVHSSQATAAGFGASLLEMFMKARTNARDGEGVSVSAPVDGMVQLVRNYRSHQDLLDLPSQLFYGGVLRSACRPEDVALPGTLSDSYDLSASPPPRTLPLRVQGCRDWSRRSVFLAF